MQNGLAKPPKVGAGALLGVYYATETGFTLPHQFALVADGSVGGEFAHARDIEDGFARPGLRVTPERADLILAFDVRLVVREDEEGVIPEEVIAHPGVGVFRWSIQLTDR
jgi:hypothetical protein